MGTLEPISTYLNHLGGPLSKFLPLWVEMAKELPDGAYERVEKISHPGWVEYRLVSANASYKDLFKSETAVGNVGQLQMVKEPAGKLRVFAMVDVLTQSTLSPLHDLLSSILKVLPNDGTSSQSSSYLRAREKSIRFGCSYGYDLSAATDRLPILIQEKILNGLFLLLGFEPPVAVSLAESWRRMLTDRSYMIPINPYCDSSLCLSHVHYAVGQPMGALSSFNMLALTHHLIAQRASRDVGLSGPTE